MGEKKSCNYCGASQLEPVVLSAGRDDELINYKVLAERIRIGETDYRITGAVGQGAHGTVLGVEDHTGASFALKVPFEFNESFSNSQGNRKSLLMLSRKYISHEVDMLNKIKSDALLKVYHAGEVTCRCDKKEKTFPAILMELAAGNLKDILDAQMSNALVVSHEEKLEIIRQLCANVHLLHSREVVHRDLSPHNVFIAARGEVLLYVPGDFGASKPTNLYDIDNSTTRLAFHDRYLDPALFLYDHFRYDHRVDIYQLGVMFTELLMGEYWQSDDDDSADFAGQSRDFEKDFLKQYAANELDPHVIDCLAKATTLTIKKRYASAQRFGNDLLKALDNAGKYEKKNGSQRLFKKNITVSYFRASGPGEKASTKDIEKFATECTEGERKKIKDFCHEDTQRNTKEKMSRVVFKGQRKIDMGTDDVLLLEFPGINVTRCRINGASFLNCHKENHSVIISVDNDDILKNLRPFYSSLSKDKEFNIEFECKANIYIEGTPVEKKNTEDTEKR
ncbi:MAG: protein kinase [bacterium]|nr:protein kinase [bacterium]